MGREHRANAKVDRKKYVDLGEIATILELSLYRVRQLVWAERFDTEIRVERKIWVERAEIEEIAKTRSSRRSKRENLQKRRGLSKTINALKVVLTLKLDDTTRKALKAFETQYAREYEKYA